MPIYVILNTVKSDGVGDFSHFEDIINAINVNKVFDDVEFLLLVLFQENEKRPFNGRLYRNLLERTKKLGHQYVFGTEQEHLNLIASFNNAHEIYCNLNISSQVIIISYDKLFDLYEPYFKKDVVIKYISEHDAIINRQKSLIYPVTNSKYQREFLIRGMGLSLNANGIKVKNIPAVTFDEAVSIIQENDPDLLDFMVNCTQAADLDELLRDNIIIPAYFNYDYKFAYFIALISQNVTIHHGKNIIIYHSGSNFNNVTQELRQAYHIQYIFENFAKCRVQIFSPNDDTPTLEYQSIDSTTLNVRVFSGFAVSNSSYRALYRLAPLAGVSGDNTFELAVATETLPVYWSTNSSFKEETFAGLQTILLNNNFIADQEVIEAYILFFRLCAEAGDDIEQFRLIDFNNLREFWPIIAKHIKMQCNFYNKIEEIVFEKMPNDSLPESKRSGISLSNFFSLFAGSDYAKTEPLSSLAKKDSLHFG